MKCPACAVGNAADASACIACGVSFESGVERVRAQLKKWQERLLDLTRANPLLGINRSRVSKLRLTVPEAYTLLGDLLRDGTKLRMPRVVKAGLEGGEAQYQVDPGDVAFEATPADLLRRLRRIHDNARTSVEERGVTTLHVSFGILTWEDQVLGESSSPLWLVPCRLENRGTNAPMLLTRVDEEMQLNPALELYLRERHRVTLPPGPDEVDAGALASFFEEVRAAVSEQDWKVEEEVWLSTYSFESLVLYQDLTAMADVALGNQVVTALARATAPRQGAEALGEETLDTMPTPEQVPVPVLPVDSSQLKALTVARAGRHLVVHGPPGTGKSQTISNLIADALGQNKKVLFVSAKMAALDVVHARLVRLGLERLCLEAHSTKAGKARIIEELKRTLAAAQDSRDECLDEHLQDFLRVRAELNTSVSELHERRAGLALSVYQAIGKIEKLRDEAEVRAPLPWPDPLAITRAELNAALEALGDLGAQADAFDGRASHPWRGLVLQPGKPVRREEIEIALVTLRELLQKLHEALTELGPLLGSAADTLTLDAVAALAEALRELATVDRLPAAWATREPEELLVTAQRLESAAADVAELRSRCAEHDRAMRVSFEEAVRLLAPAEKQFRGWTRVCRASYWKWRAAVRAHVTEGAATNIDALRSCLAVSRRVRDLEESLEAQGGSLTGEVGPAGIRNPQALEAGARRLRVAAKLSTAMKAHRVSVPQGPTDLPGDLRKHAMSVAAAVRSNSLRDAIAVLDRAWSGSFIDGVAVGAAPLLAVLARCEQILAAVPKLHEWVALQHTVNRCRALRLTPFVEALGALGARAARGAFERRFYTLWVSAMMDVSPGLGLFAGSRRQEQIERFRTLDELVRRSALARIRATGSEPARRVAAAKGGIGSASEAGTLRRELEKRTRIKPLRKLFAEVPTVLQALKPCMLMSPLSVSTFLKPGAISFDLVVFDEASQLPTPEAIPAILRAKQVVVAGDSKQLPPTSFFSASVISDEKDEAEDDAAALAPLESMLDDCVAIFPVFDHAHLRWHYRSRDERLIKFSNHYFYRERPLITFPPASTDSADRGIRLEYLPDGVWDRGGSRTNRAEARRVAQLVVEQLERHPDRSIGVVTLNVTQREAVEESLEEMVLGRPDLAPLLEPGRNEPFFIKALETVQGDERDTIVISVGYGKSPTGALSANFGPLNQEGGWRRLNVVVTRARWHTILVTSMRSEELAASVSSSNLGAAALRNFIAYAERDGELPAEASAPADVDTNDFEAAVAEALRERGLLVDEQVGASGYRIDLAVRDPRDPRRYVLGIESDGATYHRAKTARDRDLLRQEVLREQGWRLYRIWSTDWFRDRAKAIAAVLRALDQALETPGEEPVTEPLPGPVTRSAARPLDGAAARRPRSPARAAAGVVPPGET